VIGTILGAVIRGGVVVGDGDACDPRTDGRRGRGGQINQRIPFPGRIGGISRSTVGTFPMGGRVPRF
jgi:hypothetical protein